MRKGQTAGRVTRRNQKKVGGQAMHPNLSSLNRFLQLHHLHSSTLRLNDDMNDEEWKEWWAEKFLILFTTSKRSIFHFPMPRVSHSYSSFQKKKEKSVSELATVKMRIKRYSSSMSCIPELIYLYNCASVSSRLCELFMKSPSSTQSIVFSFFASDTSGGSRP